MMQAKDAIVTFVEDGLQRQVPPCGEGVVDWAALLPALGEHCPDLNLSLEDHKGLTAIPIFDPAWRAGSKMGVDDLAQVVRLAWRCEQRIAAGDLLPPGEYEAIPFAQQQEARQQASVDHLRSVVAAAGLG